MVEIGAGKSCLPLAIGHQVRLPLQLWSPVSQFDCRLRRYFGGLVVELLGPFSISISMFVAGTANLQRLVAGSATLKLRSTASEDELSVRRDSGRQNQNFSIAFGKLWVKGPCSPS